MFERLKAASTLFARAVSRPHIAVLVLRERGWRDVFAAIACAEHPTVASIVSDLQSQLPATLENLRSWYRGVRIVPDADEHLYKVRLPGGEAFLIRRSRAWQDLGTLHDVFAQGIYAHHPPVAGKTVLDIGASIGDTAVYFAQRGARVTAYEPDPEMCALARRNVEGNGLRADIRAAGVGAQTQTLRLSATHDGADSTSATLFPDDALAGSGIAAADPSHTASLPVSVVALADALAELGSVHLLKIDCQGCEYPALRSLTRAQLRAVAHVIMEFHGAPIELEAKLRACGFSVRRKGTMYLYADRGDELDRRDPTAPSA